ncbi:S-adenosyl-L-methionine-dependent methyltransferase [Globomyces pollinis-pini]|nr:S-adenosyl-L-methionine-dependent methyltransferase [Globomyces pollinis-pini]
MEFENQSPISLEQEHVHKVYNLIAGHFSQTRYKPWPVVDDYLKNIDPYSFGADVGCGNGKYLAVNPNLFLLGSDRSDELIKIVSEKGFEGLVCDGLSLGYKSNCFDFAISIAVIHHFSTAERRQQAIREILRILKPGGTVLIFVWALEQEKNSKRRFETQDEMVSWKTPAPKSNAEDPQEPPKLVTYQRYYHLFVKGELDELAIGTGMCEIIKSGYDRDNHYCILKKI